MISITGETDCRVLVASTVLCYHHHHYHMLDLALFPSTELAGFRMVIVFTTPRRFVRSHAFSFASPSFLYLILYLSLHFCNESTF